MKKIRLACRSWGGALLLTLLLPKLALAQPAPVLPNDPLFGDPDSPSEETQWGSALFRLPQAWAYAKGHGNVGVIDEGIDTRHPDLQPTTNTTVGNFRPQWSYDWDFSDPCVDELQTYNCNPQNEGADPLNVGHGSHVSGIIAASTNNGVGTAGVCWNCSLLVMKGHFAGTPVREGFESLIAAGAQVINMSFGWELSSSGASPSPCGTTNEGHICDDLTLASQHDILLVGAAGNNRWHLDLPASDPRVLAVGGVEVDKTPWDEERFDNSNPPVQIRFCPAFDSTCRCAPPSYIPPNYPSCVGQCFPPGQGLLNFLFEPQCGSNFGQIPGFPTLDLIAPSRRVLSTFYRGGHSANGMKIDCWDNDTGGIEQFGRGYDWCTGTSMSAPYVAGVAGILRSVNPLFSAEQIKSLLTRHSRCPNCLPFPNPKLGNGWPDAEASVKAALGCSGSTQTRNRLTPLFGLISSSPATDRFHTTVPQVAAGAIASALAYTTEGTAIVGYEEFPGVCGESCQTPKAAAYILTTEISPIPDVVLKPLYRLSSGSGLNDSSRDVRYANDLQDVQGVQGVQGLYPTYKLDAIEGYVYPPGPGPSPCASFAGTVPLNQYYKSYPSGVKDYALFIQGESVPSGYGSAALLGCVYPNVDSDSDGLIDGAEALLGTNPSLGDSDGDGSSDGQEAVFSIDRDPLGTVCPFFADSFEQSTITGWDAVETAPGGAAFTDPSAATKGVRGLKVTLNGTTNARAAVRDDLNQPLRRYNSQFFFNPDTMVGPNGTGHRIFMAYGYSGTSSPATLALKITFSNLVTHLELQVRKDDGTWLTASSAPLTQTSQLLEVDWTAASAPGANDGYAVLSIDGSAASQVTGVDNDQERIYGVKLGVVSNAASMTTGSYLIDEYQGRNPN